MSTTDDPDREGASTDPSGLRHEASLSELDEAEVTSLVTTLREENRRLREEYTRAQQSAYRRSAAALLVLGALGVIGGVVFPFGQEVLFVLGAIGLFGGVLTWFLTPEQFVTAAVSQSIYESVADTGAHLRNELGLTETNVYVPVRADAVDGVPIRLFVPQSTEYDLPDGEALASLYVLPEAEAERGIAVRPTAAKLVSELETSIGAVATEPEPLVGQLADGLVEQFELIDRVEPEVDAESNRITLSVQGPVYGDVGRFDHPVASFFGTGFALGLDRPVVVDVDRVDGRTLVVCRWDAQAGTGGEQ
jgi:hypothetical protein